jgi:hypothetical protein
MAALILGAAGIVIFAIVCGAALLMVSGDPSEDAFPR